MEGARLLVIDDSPTIRKLVELTLRGSGWTVSFASSGREGIQRALALPPDLVMLDYVLPDMRGIDVCARLAEDAATRAVPVVVVTAKSEQVRAQFEPFASVMACLAKPFTGEHLTRIAAAAIANRRPASLAADRGRSSPTFTRAHREAAAQTLFARLRTALALVPQWAAAMGAEPPAAYFARKLLTAERVDAILDGLLPLYREALPAQPPPARDADAASLTGELRAFPLADLLGFFAAGGRTGELTLRRAERTLVTYWRAGEIILVTTRDPDDYLAGITLGRVPADSLARAKEEQVASGRPVFVRLAEDGVALPAPLGDLLHRQGRRLLLEAVGATYATFAWRDLAALPLYVEAHGRTVSTARNTLAIGLQASLEAPPSASSLEQLALERLRRATPSASIAEDAIVDRARGFSERVRRFELDASERRVLSAIDGVHPLRDVAARVSLSEEETRAVVGRLMDVGLVAESAREQERDGARSARPVLILEPDVDGFQRPLEALLRDRAGDSPVLSLAEERDIVGAIRRERPRLVILNAGTTAMALEDTARAVRGASELADVSLVAVLEAERAREADGLRAAGFDAVLVKPVPYADLERLIG